ncbi:hypothetical protein [Bartonella sp. AP1QHHD]|uniref:hypothetical protein n=1 Tax=Bartonella sp. AP1QHHD TaxID=3243474 RepID=UPI0035CEC071
MRGNGKNAPLDKEPRTFSLEEAFLTSKNYKVIFCIAFIVAALRTALFIPMLLEWKLAGWEGDVITILFCIVQVILDLIFVLIPVAFVVRIIFTRLLKKKIEQLDQALWKRRKTAYQPNSV